MKRHTAGPRRTAVAVRPVEGNNTVRGVPPHKILLLPGMDGTGELFARLIEALPTGLEPVVVAYPRDDVLSYEQLLELVRAAAPTEPHLVFAESFSGPLGVMYAAGAPAGLKGLVLCASFVRSPAPRTVLALGRALTQLTSMGPPSGVVRALLAGMDAPAELVRAVRAAMNSVAPRVVAGRIDEISRVDVGELLAGISVPVMYIRASKDRLVGAGAWEAVRSAAPDVTVETVDSSHLVAQRQPVVVAEIIDRFAFSIRWKMDGFE